MKKLTKTLVLLLFLTQIAVNGQDIAVLQYQGGGDWYSNPTALPNLISFCNKNIKTRINPEPQTVTPESTDLFQYPMVYMTGHGNVFFSEDDAENLRDYLMSGGFLHIDDNYGMEPYLQKELVKVFPDKKLVELPASHPIFSSVYNFPKGLPKIHEHDGKRPQALGITHEGRLLLLFSYESDLGNGWENPEIHNDPEPIRQKALQMGANIVNYVFRN